MSATLTAKPSYFGLTTYQWIVILAAWLGWGFDAFDGLLFNFVGPNCVPTLLGLPIGSPEAKQPVQFWSGIMASAMLLSWAAGGVIFGHIADRIGRTHTLIYTILLYTAGTALCAVAPNIWILLLFRVISGIGIGGEWAAGASLVAEVVPESRRVASGALLYTSAPIALGLATFLNFEIAGSLLKAHPEYSWRYVFLTGLIPAAIAILVRISLREPERWKSARDAVKPAIRSLFAKDMLAATRSGLIPAVTVLIVWWTTYAFLTVLATQLAQGVAHAHGLSKPATSALTETWKAIANYSFNIGGLIGTLLTIPAARLLGRRTTFAVYFALTAAAFYVTFGMDWPPLTRLYLCVLPGLTVFGAFGIFTFYLPELFPTRLRATGAGFCYNSGRVIAAIGPFLVASVAKQGTASILHALTLLAWAPLAALLLIPFIIETRGRVLAD